MRELHQTTRLPHLKMSKLQMFRESLCVRLRTGASEIFGTIEILLAEYEDEIGRNKEECARLQHVLDIITQHNNKRHRTDVQQFSLQEPPQNKEELWTNQEEEHLQQMLTDTTNSIFTKESEMSSFKMSKLQEFEELHKEILTKAASEIFGTVEKTFADFEEKICRTNEESARLQRLLDVLTQPEIKLHRADVQLFSLQEPPQIKEEVWTNQEEEQLQELQSGPADSIFTSLSVKHCDQDFCEPPHLDIIVKVESSEGESLTSNSTEEQIKAEPEEMDCGAPEPASDSPPLSVVTPDCPTAQSSEEESGGRLPVLQQTTEVTSPSDGVINLKKRHRGVQSYQCPECDQTLSWKSELIQHMRMHTGGKPHQCQVCSKTYKRKSHVVEHMRTHTGEKPFPCQLCSKTFSQKSHVVKHLRMHTRDNPRQCQVCGKIYKRKSHVVEHMRTHTGEKPFSCQLCSKTYRQKSHVIIHMRTHTGEKPYQCQVCTKTFMYEGTYKHHVVMAHSRGKPFQCQECHQRHSCECSLKNHGKKRNKGKPYQCMKQRMSSMNESADNNTSTHTTETPFKCQECNLFYSRKSSLNIHMRKHAVEKLYQCSECSRCFQTKSDKLIHMRIHSGERPYQCQECNMTFKQIQHLSQHLKKHTGEKPFQCHECNKCFSRQTTLVQHMTSHTGEKPHQCLGCNKSFARQTSLIRHMWTHAPLKPLK